MIVDTLKNASKYFPVHPLFAKAFDYINSTDWNNTEPGKFEIDGASLKAIFTDNAGKTKEASIAKFECHNKYIDIQVCIHGNELIGWKPREKCIKENGGYNEDKDLQLYSDEPDMYFRVTDGQFAIFFPEDVHAPMIGEGNIKKLVIKVKL
jgi:YhcH/YjgK/YiaL family protein